MKNGLLILSSALLASCSWGPKTVSTKSYDISDIHRNESIEELRVFTKIGEKCATETLGKETVLPLGAVVLGSAIKQIAAYGKEQVDIAIKYLQGDVKISGKSLLSNANMTPAPAPTPSPKLCMLAIYGTFKTTPTSDDKNKTIQTFKKIQIQNKIDERDNVFIEDLKEYEMAGVNSENPVDSLIGNPVFMVEMKAYVVTGSDPSSSKYLYKVTPTFLWYPHSLHKGVFQRAKRDLSVEVAFADVKSISPLDGFPAGFMYKGSDFASRFSLVEGSKSATVNVVSVTVIEGPDKVPTDKALAIVNDAIKAKAEELSKEIEDKNKPEQ
ncbi:MULTISPECIES: hypothetical protein [Pseudomonas]|nr:MULTISPECIES: hypothetical protein [Pseudomonas]BBP66266.1 hypothetical protein PHLH5_38070 [Pseudomonas sp. Cab53]